MSDPSAITQVFTALLDAATKVRFPSGVLSIIIDEEQVAVVRWLGS